MFLEISIFLSSVVLTADIYTYFYQDSLCNVDLYSNPASTSGTCEEYLQGIRADCVVDGNSNCDSIELNTCSTHAYLGAPSAILECLNTFNSPTMPPTEATCDDLRMNGDETGVDCGGLCPACPTDCSDYDCEANYILIENPELHYCKAFPCNTTDLDRCCNKKAPCFELQFGDGCLTGEVLISNANSTYCESTECDYNDRDQCCTATGNCANFDLCDSTTQYLKASPESFSCAGEVCGETDISKCCEDKAVCTTYSCDYDGGLTLQLNHTTTWCALAVCQASDSSDCCTNRGSCATFTCDESKYVEKSDKNSRYCSGITCEYSDNSFCCTLKQTCEDDRFTYSCSGTGNSLVDDPESVHCTGEECEQGTDDDICCPDEITVCDSNACNLANYFVNTTENCLGNPCTLSDTQCCIQRAQCTGFLGCDDMTQYVDDNAYCAGDVCHTTNDIIECCVSKESCTEFPDGCAPLTEIQSTTDYCTSSSCTSSDTHCCIAREQCTDYTQCDAITEYVDDSAYCAGEVCDSSDTATCCIEREACTEFSACDSTAQYLDDSSYCAAATCDTQDETNCCIDKASCSIFTECDVSTQSIINGNYCAMENCDSSDVSNCCLDLASCAGFGFCGEGLKLDEAKMCAADICTETDDVGNCCIVLAKCDSYSCDSTTEIPIADASTTYCVGATCEASDDCCESKALCSTFDSCSICDVLVDGAYCAEASCNSLDYDTCCMEIISDLDDSMGVTFTWSVFLEGDDLDEDDLDAIRDHLAHYLDLPCSWVDASYTANGSNWHVTYELFASTDGNEDAGADLEADLTESSSIDGLVAHIRTKLGFDISVETLSLSSEETSSAKESGLSTGVIIAIVVAIALLLAAIGFAVYKHKQPKSVGQKMNNLVEM